MTRIIFEKKKSCNEYIVYNKHKDVLGEIVYWKIDGHKNPRWWFFVDWNPMDSSRDFWMGADCLKEIAKFLDELTKKKEESNG